MGHIAPLFLAFILNCCGVYIFVTPKSLECLPYVSYVIFLISVFFLLWDIKLFPVTFRKLLYLPGFIIEFSISMMLMELIINNFWYPLEIALITFLQQIGDSVVGLMNAFGFKCTGICKFLEFLRWHGTLLIASYLLSIFFLLCIMHMTRIVDFRLLRCGDRAFLKDSKKRGQEFCGKIIRTLKPHHRRVCFAPGTKNCAYNATARYTEDDDESTDPYSYGNYSESEDSDGDHNS